MLSADKKRQMIHTAIHDLEVQRFQVDVLLVANRGNQEATTADRQQLHARSLQLTSAIAELEEEYKDLLADAEP